MRSTGFSDFSSLTQKLATILGQKTIFVKINSPEFQENNLNELLN